MVSFCSQACQLPSRPDCNEDTSLLYKPFENYLEISIVGNEIRTDDTHERHVRYLIQTISCIDGIPSTTISKRFSDFEVFKDLVLQADSHFVGIELPGKNVLGRRFDKQFIGERQLGLERFLRWYPQLI